MSGADSETGEPELANEPTVTANQDERDGVFHREDARNAYRCDSRWRMASDCRGNVLEEYEKGVGYDC